MHDPMTVCWDIKLPYFGTVATVWHVDPETDGSDDSCGWFKRSRHGNKDVLKQIESQFDFDWDKSYGGWFFTNGEPRLSVMGIVVNMFRVAAFNHFKKNHRKADRFMRRHLYDILHLAENNVDSLYEGITSRYGEENRQTRIEHMASAVYGCILRWSQPWYRHARWHVWHWRIQIHSVQQFKRWAFSRCCRCGKGFKYGESPCAGWDSEGPKWFRSERSVYHSGCDDSKVI